MTACNNSQDSDRLHRHGLGQTISTTASLALNNSTIAHEL